MGENLFNKIWQMHTVKELDSGQTQLFIGLHYIHEVTSPQAFHMLRERGLKVMFPDRTFAAVDHIVPTKNVQRPFEDPLAEELITAMETNTKENNISFFHLGSSNYGIVHVIGPELGLTQPGMTITCGDSHTSTHGAFGSIAFGIGTSQVRDVLATQTLAIKKPKVRKINISGELDRGVSAKDLILFIIQKLGVKGGAGYAYEFSGEVISRFSMDERMTVCNMSIEGGARFGYINPDRVTFDYLKDRKFAPREFDKAVKYWQSVTSDADSEYDDEVEINAGEVVPMVTWGINPGQSVGINDRIPKIDEFNGTDRDAARLAYDYMGFSEDQQIRGTKIDKIFIGSCTNGRISDLREAADILKDHKIADNVNALAVPGSKLVREQAEKEGLDHIFIDAGFEWREPGCSMCLAMNPDKLTGNELCASTSNRNFIGRQGSPQGRTILLSPAMAAAAAIEGEICDVRKH
ncbi:3-isopropylmalate dehydratase large subunit [candidate division KSB1 bacterium]